MRSAKGFQTVYFGVLPIPDMLDKNKEIGDLLALVHKSLNLLFVAVLAGHSHDGLELIRTRLELVDERAHLDCFRAGAEDEHYLLQNDFS